MQDKLQEIKQNTETGSSAEAKEQDSDIGFLQEEIKKRPRNRKKMMRQMMTIAIMAAVFGAVACLFFLLLEPIFTRMLYPEEAVTGVTYPEETETEELTPEEMLVNEEEKAATEEQERIREEVERIMRDKEWGTRTVVSFYGALRSAATESLYFLVDVSEISSDTDWFNDPYETRGTVSGIIIAKTDSEAQILVYSPGINAAQTIQVTFFDGSSVEGSIRSYDSVSGIAVLSVSLEGVKSETKESLKAAELGSSAPSVVSGRAVIAVGRPTGNSGSIAYGAVTSATANLPIQDSGFQQLTTDIYASKNASGVLIGPDGLVVGIIDSVYGRPDMPNILCAIGITETKQLIEKLSAGGKKAYLGVQCTDVPSDVRSRMNIPDGVYLSGVTDDSPAMNAGLQKGDVITYIGEEEVHSSVTISRILLENEPGTEISITLLRPSGEGYTEMELSVTLG
jgi:S1-C subfamily serine protease